MSRHKIPTSFAVDPDLREWLKQQAEKEQRSQVTIIERALRKEREACEIEAHQ